MRAILINPRYTGYEVWNKQRKEERLLDVDDVALGHRTSMTHNPAEAWIRSNEPAHEAIISPDLFDTARTVRQQRARTQGRQERAGKHSARPYVLRGRIRCTLCGRKMQPTPAPRQAPRKLVRRSRLEHARRSRTASDDSPATKQPSKPEPTPPSSLDGSTTRKETRRPHTTDSKRSPPPPGRRNPHSAHNRSGLSPKVSETPHNVSTQPAQSRKARSTTPSASPSATNTQRGPRP
ncbi:recombinase family protein [Streptomyces malaysiensis]|uniref:recombinase family protein n=1 Tax=Streptomyces malaysiensis TaxID=92644 RepID=UPI001BE412A8